MYSIYCRHPLYVMPTKQEQRFISYGQKSPALLPRKFRFASAESHGCDTQDRVLFASAESHGCDTQDWVLFICTYKTHKVR
jgi:hypothetical protein